MPKYGKFEELKKQLLHKKIVSWEIDKLILEDGTEVSIQESEQDCCATADGDFKNVVLDAVITQVSEPLVTEIPDDDTEWNAAVITIYHNHNIIALADCNANAGNGGYYYSVCSLVVDGIHYKVVEA